jgi:dihydrofolate reductase
MKLSLIAAAAQNDVIGRDGGLPWHLSSDLKRFKRLTMGHALVMGRRTYASIGRPLPGRVSIVLTRDPGSVVTGEHVLVATDLDEAIALVADTDMDQNEAFVIGGAEIYRLALPRAERIYLTRVLAEVEGDVRLPAIDWDKWTLVEEAQHEAGERDDFPFKLQTFERCAV